MAAVGPWVPDRPDLPVAVAVSGGADSLCLAILARRWRRSVVAFVVDHGLRVSSRDEADLTCDRLKAQDIAAIRLDVKGLVPGNGVQARARTARYEALTQACVRYGCVDLLLGHHARDQAETVMIRQRARSGPDGLAGMATVAETASLRLVRPLLGVAPERLRARLAREAIAWVDDPSNDDPRYERVRTRRTLTPWRIGAACATATEHGCRRTIRAARHADELARAVLAHPAGWILLRDGGISVESWAALIRSVAGSAYRISPERIAGLFVETPRPMTIGHARIVRAGRYGHGWIVQREQGDDAMFRRSGSGISVGDAVGLPASIKATLPVWADGGFEIATQRAATDESRWG